MGLVYVLMVGFDYVYVCYEFIKGLCMLIDEVWCEYKDVEGDLFNCLCCCMVYFEVVYVSFVDCVRMVLVVIYL